MTTPQPCLEEKEQVLAAARRVAAEVLILSHDGLIEPMQTHERPQEN
jgi:hypothetical protein